MPVLDSLRSEIRPMLALAAPLVAAELGWMAMGIVDTMMVGRLPDSAIAIGAVSLGSVLYYTCTIFGGALLLGLDTLISQAFGAGRVEDCNRSLWTGLFLALALTPPLMLLNYGLAACLPFMRVNPAVAPMAARYIRILNWGTPALMTYFVLRRYLQAMSLARTVMFTVVSANLINFAGNWAFIYGRWGAPALGTDGSAWSSAVARVYMAAMFAGFLVYYDRRRSLAFFRGALAPDWARMGHLLRLGIPAATHMGLEMAVFALATALIAQLDAISLAAHQIALNVASITFMVPLGISAAAAVRVGHAIGRGDPHGAARSGWTALGLGAAFMACSAVALTAMPARIAALYTPDPVLIRGSIVLLSIAAVFQLFDGFQIVASGALRGAGDTRTPMLCNLVFYWFIGLPLGYFLCFYAHWGAAGLWVGLCLALVLIGSVLLWVWRDRVRELRHDITMPIVRSAAGSDC